MCEVACTGAIEYLIIHFKGFKELGQDDAAHAVDGIHADAELAILDRLEFGELQLEHTVDMAQVEREIFCVLT